MEISPAQKAQRETQHRQELESMQKRHEERVAEMEKAYELEISRKAEQHARDLTQVNQGLDEELKTRKRDREQEFSKLEERERTRTENFMKKQESILQRLHEKYQLAQDDIERRNKG